jgi:putative endonuclease
MTTTYDVGRRAEQLAVDYLRQKGFTIRHTNWRMGHKEVDIVAEKENRIHIVEVRSLNSSVFHQPYQTINRQKQRNLIDAAHFYIRRYKLNMEVQLDVISIVFNGDNFDVEYIPNAIYPKV